LLEGWPTNVGRMCATPARRRRRHAGWLCAREGRLRGSEGGRIAASDIRRTQPKITGKIDRQLVRAEQQNGLGVDAETL